MKNAKNILWALPLFSILFFTSCEKEDPFVPNEEELITTLIYTLTPVGGGTAVEFRFQDLDGDGGTAPVITSGTLAANTSYTGILTLLNEAVSPAESISDEIAAEAEDHQFFFSTTHFTFIDGSIAYEDEDANGFPIGLLTTFAVGSVTHISLTIVLRHEPNKAALGVSIGGIDNAGGETDIEVEFDIPVQ
ncbi:MAG: type 1 periplasmic binding fold superfamily protein [Flavobacteriales bacterium]|nr:type 1 periplasmic binding fold superfamily protein [Flavobacteriales bacterium]